MTEYLDTLAFRRQGTIYDTARNHFSGQQKWSFFVLFEAIRKVHPDKHLTSVNNCSVNLIHFAKAGQAKARLIRDDGEYLLARTYSPPVGRLYGSQGRLADDVSFGHYEYTWQDHVYDIYDAEIRFDDGNLEHLLCILTPREEADDEGHSALADALIRAAGKWKSDIHKEILVYDSDNWEKSKTLYSAVQAASWEDVILDSAMKTTLIQDVESFFDNRDAYKEFGVPWKRGIIFHGAPGCGKTISIKALMNTMSRRDVVSLYVKSFESTRGSRSSIRRIFQRAREMAPCILILEDMDSLVTDKLRSYFLNEVDGLEDNDGILMIGSTNHLSRLDPAIAKRPSRFDRKYHFRLPADAERLAYARYWRQKVVRSGRVDFPEDVCEVVVQLTDGFSFAYMKELFVQTFLSFAGGRGDVDDVEEDLVVVDGSASLLKSGEKLESSSAVDANKKRNGKNVQEQEEKPIRNMPQVEIPDHLQDNTIMRIIYRQFKALWKEMDNTTDEVDGCAKIV